MSRIYDNALVQDFRKYKKWFYFPRDETNIYFSLGTGHNFNNHVHFFKAREGGFDAYIVKKDGKNTGLKRPEKGQKAKDFEHFFFKPPIYVKDDSEWLYKQSIRI